MERVLGITQEGEAVMTTEATSVERIRKLAELLTEHVRVEWPRRTRAAFEVADGIAVNQVAIRLAGCHVAQLLPDRQAILRIAIDVPDLNDGHPSRITFSAEVPWPADRRGRAETVRKALHQVLAHEVDEALFVDGGRPYDPHRQHPVEFTFAFGEQEEQTKKPT